MTYSDLRMYPERGSDNKVNEVLDPTVFSWEDRVTESTSIFKARIWETICYFCDFWEKPWLRENNGVICENPKSLVYNRITSWTNNCSQFTESL